MENLIEIRDKRSQDWYWSDNHFIDAYGELLGVNAVAVYSVLCRHANNNTQKCWPSMETIGQKAGIKNRKTVSKAIAVLAEWGIITIEKGKLDTGQHINNRYQLNNQSLWRGVIVIKETPTPVLKDDVFDTIVETKKSETIYPEWLDMKAWHKWETHRKEIKKKLTPLSIASQLKLLEQYKDQQAEIIERSIIGGWQTLYALKPNKTTYNQKPDNIINSKENKYAHLS